MVVGRYRMVPEVQVERVPRRLAWAIRLWRGLTGPLARPITLPMVRAALVQMAVEPVVPAERAAALAILAMLPAGAAAAVMPQLVLTELAA